MEHNISLKNRELLAISGVEHVYSFNDNKIEIKTSHGDMKIEGENLDMGKLNLEEGLVTVKGTVNSITYSKVSKKDEEGFFKKIFK
ncbi:sporulation protein YabP [Alkalithermobacter thermoalcaliphilus JW-YL-7 = DSM 7308]|uniref:Sporulation protein YabP n=1 Tax=Alkalithermobacter thermoalcaliphilus JW-YL-7 = DSM 7308 TaxID=1121328 RepID=A0A150FTU3_CLOPD|nr:sporulation protein YabP [[Clostridium] paradoxum JW-YL-7 = DSM 7308]SHK69478.1 sporulation protein YabP [[Clostridium] paradoxum JW-YL-7 = DSM 7308]